ncbi:MAG: bestrophin family ion channel [Cyclobacteriaceae bacterium]|nr:bestrophin family ion channel [Cytophagales bacterium]MCZ8326852.1 bestrophin family ion channel [Cyclobacteriaceae bacterium]
MIKYNPKVWVSLIFHSYSKQVMRTLMPALLLTVLFSALVAFVFHFFAIDNAQFPATIGMHSLLGIVLGLFLVFRTNSAYDRWWEGRKLWGSMVNSTRNLAIKLNAFVSAEELELREWFSASISNFVFASKEHLRRGVNMHELTEMEEGFKETLKKYSHKPNYLAGLLFKKVNALYKQGKLSGDQLLVLDKELKDFMDIVGACERIKYTPIPYSYSMYIKKFIFIYVITLPFAFVTTYSYFTLIIVAIITFVLLSIELIAEEIEDPFGKDVNDLPTDELAVKIKENVREILLA